MYSKYVELRDKKGVKDADVAKGAGIYQSILTAWKNGDSTPKVDKLIKIADYLECSLEDLVR